MEQLSAFLSLAGRYSKGEVSSMIRNYALVFSICLSLLFIPSIAFGETEHIETAEQQVPGYPQKADTIPPRILIPGVPFTSWQEASRLEYSDKGVINPSIIASYGMVFEFWGKNRKLLEKADSFELSGLQRSSDRQSGKAWTVVDLKASLAKGIPVVISLPLTPYAHPLYMTFEMGIALGQIKGVELKDQGRPRSNALGRMVSLEDLEKIKGQMDNLNPVRESVIAALRLFIGYDDDRKVFIVHDPSFGPAFEIGYDDFDKMWSLADNNYSIMFPADLPQEIPEELPAAHYRNRTPDERAAMHFVYGYALDCVCRLADGKAYFEKGLSTAGISKGYEFLLRFELALNLAEQGDIVRAIEEAEKATSLLPEHPAPGTFYRKRTGLTPKEAIEKRQGKLRKN
jgi:tetratricopeptide (TPR) repeat protein